MTVCLGQAIWRPAACPLESMTLTHRGGSPQGLGDRVLRLGACAAGRAATCYGQDR